MDHLVLISEIKMEDQGRKDRETCQEEGDDTGLIADSDQQTTA